MIATTEPDCTEFILEVQHARLHPALEALLTIRTENWNDADWRMLAPAVVAVEVVSEQDARDRGEPEDAGTLVFGHQILLAAREDGWACIRAREAEIPAGMSAEEFVLRRLVERERLDVGQRSLVAALVKRLLLEKRRQAMASPQGDAQDAERQAGAEAAGVGGVSRGILIEAEELLQGAPDIAEKVLRGECPLHVASAILARRQEKASRPSKASRLQDGLDEVLRLLEGSGDGLNEHQNRITELIRELRHGLEEGDSGDAPGGHTATAGEQHDDVAQASEHAAEGQGQEGRTA